MKTMEPMENPTKRLIAIGLLALAWANPNTAVSAAAADTAKNDWPRFRGPNGDGLSPTTGIPTTWSKDKNVLWKADLPKAFKIVPRDVIAEKPADLKESGSPSDMQSKAFNPYSSPIVSGGKVFIASAGIRTSEHSLLCFQLSDGKLLWETPVPPGPLVVSELNDILDEQASNLPHKKRPNFGHRYGYNCTTPCTDMVSVALIIWRRV